MSRPAFPSLVQVREIGAIYTRSIPADWEDMNGHVNVQFYLTLYEESGWPLMADLGLEMVSAENQLGIFDLEHHLYFLAEVHVGELVSVHSRIFERSEKRFHGMVFIVNDTRECLACTLEYVGTGADLSARRTAAIPAAFAEGLDREILKSEALSWEAPRCGVMSV